MVPCAILAAGVAAFQPDCLADTKVGISTSAYLRAHTTAIDAETVLISLGVNDGETDHATADRLAGLRLQITARRVFWILPARPEAVRQVIRDIAHAFGDRLIDTRGYTASDGLHLSSQTYRTIATIFDVFGRRSQDAPAQRGRDEATKR